MLTDGNLDNASARIRVIQYIPFFESQDFRVTHIPRIPKRPTNPFLKFSVFPVLKRWYSLKITLAILFGKWDIVFIQRIFVNKSLLKILVNRSIKVIYDFDDAIYLNPKRPKNRGKASDMIRFATNVIVSTNYLAEFCLNSGQSPMIIPSPIETDRIKPTEKSKDQIVTIGWIGSPWTTSYLELIETPLQKLAEKYSFRFITVGARHEYKIEGVDHISKPWVFDLENEDIGHMDIGIMPLPDTDWTKMKGGYKLLQYMSAGIPCVASPVGINQSIVRPGENGYLASNDDEWYLILEKLIVDSSLRARLGSNGRKDAVELYSREVCFKKIMVMIKSI